MTPDLNKILSIHWATYLLVSINVIIFGIYGFKNPDTLKLLDLGGNFAPFSLQEEPSRLVTSMFLHGHLFHLIANMYGLFYLGIQIEKKTGSINFLVVYFLTGLVAGITSLNFNLFVVSVGASGAIFGIYGFLIVETIKNNPKNKASILINFIIYLLIVTFIGARLNFDNAAHIGGAAAGITIRLLQDQLKLPFIYIILSSIIITSYVITPRYQVAYFESYQRFVSTDLNIAKTLNAGLSDNDFYDSLSGIKHLPEKSITDFRAIEFIPHELTGDTTLIINFLNLRKRQIDYLLKGLSKESFIYLDSVRLVSFQISQLPQIQYNLNFKIPSKPENINQDSSEHLTIVRQQYDSNWFETDAHEFEYFRIGQKDSLDNWHGSVEDYYKDGAIQMKGSYHRGLKNGIFIYYESDSSYVSAGRYYADNEIGKWENFHKNGQLHAEIRYENKFAYVENTWDSLGNQMILDRNGEEIYKYPNGKISYRRKIQDGLTHGFIESFYENGNLRFREYHENGELIKGVSFFNQTKNTYDASVYVPYPEGGYDAFYEYIDKENKMRSDSIQEVVVMRFDVHYTGKVNNIRFLRRFRKDYDEYARELLLNGPAWIPARSHGLYEINSFAEVTIIF